MSALGERLTLLASRDDLLVGVLREIVQLAEAGRDRAEAREVRLGEIEARVERLVMQVAALATHATTPPTHRSMLHADVLPPPATIRATGHEIARAREQAVVAAKARGHRPGPWTVPADGGRDQYAACHLCGAALTVSTAAALGGAALAGTCPKAQPDRAAPPARPPRKPPRLRAKSCGACHREFLPGGPRALYCRQPPCPSAER